MMLEITPIYWYIFGLVYDCFTNILRYGILDKHIYYQWRLILPLNSRSEFLICDWAWLERACLDISEDLTLDQRTKHARLLNLGTLCTRTLLGFAGFKQKNIFPESNAQFWWISLWEHLKIQGKQIKDSWYSHKPSIYDGHAYIFPRCCHVKKSPVSRKPTKSLGLKTYGGASSCSTHTRYIWG